MVLGNAGVPTAVFGVPLKTPHGNEAARVGQSFSVKDPVGGTLTGATGTVAIPVSTESERSRFALGWIGKKPPGKTPVKIVVLRLKTVDSRVKFSRGNKLRLSARA